MVGCLVSGEPDGQNTGPFAIENHALAGKGWPCLFFGRSRWKRPQLCLRVPPMTSRQADLSALYYRHSTAATTSVLPQSAHRSAIHSHWCAVQLRCNSKCTEARHSHPLLRVSLSILSLPSHWLPTTMPHVSGAALPLKPCECPSSICARQLRSATAELKLSRPWRALPCEQLATHGE